MSFWGFKIYIFCAIFAFFLIFFPKNAHSESINAFFSRIMTEKPQEFYIKSFSSIEKIAMKGIFDAESFSWMPAILAVDFFDTDFDNSAAFLPSGVQNESENAENPDDERFFRDQNGAIRLFLAGKESEMEEFSVSADGKNFQSANENAVFRTEYDDFMRVSRKIRWKIEKTEKNPELFSVERFEYASDEAREPILSVENMILENRVKKIFFGENALPKRISVSENGEKLFEQILLYDGENRVISDSSTKYSATGSQNVRRDYSYTKRSSEPDLRVFENGELRLVTEYAEEGVWTTTTYFDGGYAVSVHFSHGEKKIETVYLNDRVVRRRRF